jgi:hypothetical protein
MNENELKLLWQSVNDKLEDSLKLNKKNAEDITKMKVQNFLSSMKPLKIFTLAFGILWVAVLGSVISNLFVNAYHKVSLFFLYSAAIQVLLTAIAVAMYIYQLGVIYKIDFSKPVFAIQEKLLKLKISSLNVVRILFLQLPVWTTFYWNEKMFVNGNLFLWIMQLLITLSVSFLAVWLFLNIKYQNRNKRWFKLIFIGKEWQPILQAVELLNQTEKYQEGGSENASY